MQAWRGWAFLSVSQPLPHSRLASLLGSGPGISPPKSLLLLLLSLLLLFLAVLGICCCRQPFSSCDARASHGAGISCCGAPTLGTRASVVVASGLSRSACGIFPNQGLNLCLLHRQADS